MPFLLYWRSLWPQTLSTVNHFLFLVQSLYIDISSDFYEATCVWPHCGGMQGGHTFAKLNHCGFITSEHLPHYRPTNLPATGFLTCCPPEQTVIKTLRPRSNGCHFADDTFKCIILNENIRISMKNSLKFVPKGPINNIAVLVQIMAWRRPGEKPLSEPMMVRSSSHICLNELNQQSMCCFADYWRRRDAFVTAG